MVVGMVCGGYHYSDNVIYGFSHTHLNGTGVSDYGDIMLMPTMGEPSFDNKVYSSLFSHDNEKSFWILLRKIRQTQYRCAFNHFNTSWFS